MAEHFTRQDVSILSDDTVYDGFFQLRRLRLRHRLFAGGWSEPLTREVLMRHQAVGVLLYDPQRDAVALVEQFRIGAFCLEEKTSCLEEQASPWLFELVAGLIDEGESPQQVAMREALEESGCKVTALEWVARYFASPGGTNEYLHLYCGRADLSSAGGIHGLADEGEDIRVRVIAASDCFDTLAQGRISNAHTLIALQWLQLHHQRLRRQWQEP